MKLPTESPAPASIVGSGNGYYGQGNHNVTLILAPPSPDPVTNGDFSEYLWMENEEEFEREVFKELEEQALMEQCLQAMIEDSSPMTSPTPWHQADASPVYLPDVQNAPGSELIMAMRGLQVHEHGNSVASSQDQPKSEFKFNPMAKEFIPGMSWHPASNRSSCFPELVEYQPDA